MSIPTSIPAIGHETLALTLNEPEKLQNIPENARYAKITIENGWIRYWIDGSDPSMDEGHLFSAPTELSLVFNNATQLQNFRAINIRDILFSQYGETTLQITYF